MKVDIIEYCKFSSNGINVKHCQAGEKNIDMPNDIAIAFIGYGFVKESKLFKKAIEKAPENKMLKGAPENKSQKQKLVRQEKVKQKKRVKKASKK